METDCKPMELSSMSGFDENAEINGFEGTDMKDMRLEAEAVVNDVLFAVNNMFVSKTLRCADDVAYINVETREGDRYCLELTEAGLKVSAFSLQRNDLVFAASSVKEGAGGGRERQMRTRHSVASKIFLQETYLGIFNSPKVFCQHGEVEFVLNLIGSVTLITAPQINLLVSYS